MQFTHTDTQPKENSTEHLPNPATKPDRGCAHHRRRRRRLHSFSLKNHHYWTGRAVVSSSSPKYYPTGH